MATDPVLTLGDLDAWSFAGTALAVLGQPIKHSVSPAMHNAALSALADVDPRFRSWRYFRFEIAPSDLPAALPRLFSKGFHGLNLTVPHKVLAVDHVTAIDPAAQPIGAVNTLLRTPAGWHGFNTDGYGLATGVQEDLGMALKDAQVILLGAGGAARGVAVECLQRGCASLSIGNRTQANLDALLTALAPLAGQTQLRGFSPTRPPADLPQGALIINATSAGLQPGDPLPIDLASLPRPAGVYDTIYNPRQTALLRTAESRGIPHANGLSMLVHQGARSLSLWTGLGVPVDTMRRAATAALSYTGGSQRR